MLPAAPRRSCIDFRVFVYEACDQRDDATSILDRVFNERERVEVLDAIDSMRDALQYVNEKVRAKEDQQRAKFQRERIRELLDLAQIGKQLLDALVKDAKVDGTPLMKVLLGGNDK